MCLTITAVIRRPPELKFTLNTQKSVPGMQLPPCNENKAIQQAEQASDTASKVATHYNILAEGDLAA